MHKIQGWLEKCTSCKSIFEYVPNSVILKYKSTNLDWHVCPICKKLTIVRKTNLSTNI